MKKSYQTRKEAARWKAIDWQINIAPESLSYAELDFWASYFSRLGRRYGLLREFRENGIC